MTRIRDEDVFDFLIIYYAGYSDCGEMQASFKTETYHCALVEGIDYKKEDIQDIWQLHALAWSLVVIISHTRDELVTEIKLLGVSHETINI